MARFDGLIGPTYESVSRIIDGELAMNLYAQLVESGQGKSKYSLLGTPGRRVHATLPDTPVRGLFFGDHRLFAVGGGTLCEVFQDGTFRVLGAVTPSTVPAQIFSNNRVSDDVAANQLFIVSGGQGFIADGTSVTPVVTASTGTFIDGYFLASQPDSNKFKISGINDGFTWDDLDFGIKSGWFDKISAIYADHGLLWIFGFQTTEVWADTGAANFPFQKIQGGGGFIEHGLVAPLSPAKVGETMMWLSGDAAGSGVVMQAQGLVANRASNHAVEQAIQRYPQIQDAVGYSYQEDGHPFYILGFPTADATWAYDLATGFWHQRGTWDAARARFKRDRAAVHAYGGWPTNPSMGLHFTGDPENGNIYVQSNSLFDDAGGPLRRVRRAPHLSNENLRTAHIRLELDVEKGGAAQGLKPKIMMRYSDDGGQTWSNERVCSMGEAGQYRQRVYWSRNGSGRDRVYELSTTDGVQQAWAAAYITTSPGS